MLLYGAGGHAKVIISCIRANGSDVPAIFDDNPLKTELTGIRIFGKYDPGFCPDQPIIIAVGDNLLRSRISKITRHLFGTALDPSALIDKSVLIGDGTVVMHQAVLQADVQIGEHVIVNTGVIMEHDCRLADFVHLAPGVVLCGNVSVGRNTLIGAGSIVVPNTTIGSNCLVAAGTVITRNIPDGSVVRGNPGRIIRKIC
jgi:sugar O-acyltransferase (sialic acid O-acetyltransferase NeuD family)